MIRGKGAPFAQVPNGIPGIETRLPLLFSEGVGKGRITLNRFVALTATNPARLFGLYPRKGTIAVGSDADLAIWDPEREVIITNDILHHNVDYTPYEGMKFRAGRKPCSPGAPSWSNTGPSSERKAGVVSCPASCRGRPVRRIPGRCPELPATGSVILWKYGDDMIFAAQRSPFSPSAKPQGPDLLGR